MIKKGWSLKILQYLESLVVNAVYEFFADVFALDSTKIDESKVTIETADALKANLPVDANPR